MFFFLLCCSLAVLLSFPCAFSPAVLVSCRVLSLCCRLVTDTLVCQDGTDRFVMMISARREEEREALHASGCCLNCGWLFMQDGGPCFWSERERRRSSVSLVFFLSFIALSDRSSLFSLHPSLSLLSLSFCSPELSFICAFESVRALPLISSSVSHLFLISSSFFFVPFSRAGTFMFAYDIHTTITLFSNLRHLLFHFLSFLSLSEPSFICVIWSVWMRSLMKSIHQMYTRRSCLLHCNYKSPQVSSLFFFVFFVCSSFFRVLSLCCLTHTLPSRWLHEVFHSHFFSLYLLCLFFFLLPSFSLVSFFSSFSLISSCTTSLLCLVFLSSLCFLFRQL